MSEFQDFIIAYEKYYWKDDGSLNGTWVQRIKDATRITGEETARKKAESVGGLRFFPI